MKNRLLIFLLLITFFLSSCSRKQSFPYVKKTQLMMGTFVTISVYDQDKTQKTIAGAVDRAFRRIHALENETSYFIPDNAIWKLNRFSGKRPVAADLNLIRLFREAEKISDWTAGGFDVTVGPLRRLWNFDSTRTTLPDSEAVARLVPLVDYRDIEMTGHSLFLKKPGMQVDLGGIAKGFAVDEAMKVLKSFRVTDAMVDAGGDFSATASSLTAGKRKVWIRHPRKPNAFFGWFPMDSGCVATSGDYEQFFIINGVRYHHILDPKTGWPARKCVSVTIVAPTAMKADALATGVFVLGPEAGMKVIEAHPGIEGVILFRKNAHELGYRISSGLQKKLTIVDTSID